MTYTHNLSFFSVLVFGIIIEPGMDMFFVIANALTGGRARGSGGGGVYDSTGGCG